MRCSTGVLIGELMQNKMIIWLWRNDSEPNIEFVFNHPEGQEC